MKYIYKGTCKGEDVSLHVNSDEKIADSFDTVATWDSFRVEAYEDNGELLFEDAPFDIDNNDLDADEVTELRRRMDDLDDPKRYFIVSSLMGSSYYNVETDCWSDSLEYCTGFKRLKYAEAVMKLLGKDGYHSIEEHEVEV